MMRKCPALTICLHAVCILQIAVLLVLQAQPDSAVGGDLLGRPLHLRHQPLQVQGCTCNATSHLHCSLSNGQTFLSTCCLVALIPAARQIVYVWPAWPSHLRECMINLSLHLIQPATMYFDKGECAPDMKGRVCWGCCTGSSCGAGDDTTDGSGAESRPHSPEAAVRVDAASRQCSALSRLLAHVPSSIRML